MHVHLHKLRQDPWQQTSAFVIRSSSLRAYSAEMKLFVAVHRDV